MIDRTNRARQKAPPPARIPSRGIAEAAARDAALADENVLKFLDGKQVRKTIFVPDRLLNLVVG